MDGELNYRNTINSWRRDGGSIAGASSWGYCIRSSGEDGICGYRDLISPSIRFHQGVSPQSRALSGLLSSSRAISENEQCTTLTRIFTGWSVKCQKMPNSLSKLLLMSQIQKENFLCPCHCYCLCLCLCDDW